MKKTKKYILKILNNIKSNYELYLILLLSSFLNFSNLKIEEYANEYYAAGVRSMTMSLKNFFFVAFDPSGFVTIDKPPVGFWLQAISAKIFGFSGWSIILPQALAGVISVGLLYYVVNRYFGKVAGLIAALCLSITPIFVAASRNNTIDNLLVLTSIIACLFLGKSVEKGEAKYLVISLIFVGIGFNIKMLEAYMILPALYVTYLVASSISIRKRIVHLIFGTMVLVTVSFSWAVIVDLIPAKDRPFIGSSTNNTVMELIAGHNGAERLNFKPSNKQETYESNEKDNAVNTQKVTSNGAPGLERLFAANNLSDQISWFLPLAILGLIASIINENWKDKSNKARKLNLILWGMCLIPECIYFSFIGGIGHAYYLTMMSPSIAALVGIGLENMWELSKNGGIRALLLPASLIINGASELLILSYFDFYYITKRIMMIVGVVSFASSIILIICTFIKKENLISDLKKSIILKKALLIAAFMGLIVTPSFWSFTTVVYRMSGGAPEAGLRLINNENHEIDTKEWFMLHPNSNVHTDKLSNFLSSHEGNEKYYIAVEKANDIADLIVKTGEPAMAIGGFSGRDKILTLDEFKSLVKNGEVKYAFLRKDENQNKEIDKWIRENGKPINIYESNRSSGKKKNNVKDTNEIVYELS